MFIGMTGQDKQGPAEAFIDRFGLRSFAHTFDESADSWDAFDRYTVPAYMFVNDDGTATAYDGTIGGPAELDKELTLLLNS